MAHVKIAYLLLCHKNAEQTNMFVSQLLNYGDGDVYIHLDSKSKTLGKEIVVNERVKVYSQYNVKWGSFEIVLAGILLMKKAMESGVNYTHFYVGSGQDLLVKKGLHEYLESTNKSAYIRIEKELQNKDRGAAKHLVCWPDKWMIRNDLHPYRFARIFVQAMCKLGIVFWKNPVKLKNPIRFYEGRTWFFAKRELIEYILKYTEDNPDYVRYWEKSLASDLMFFQTIIMNSPYANDIVDELMYVQFGTTFRTMNHPITITMSDVDKIEKGNYFIARKFELGECSEVVEYYLNRL